jgi:hypothetical protein
MRSLSNTTETCFTSLMLVSAVVSWCPAPGPAGKKPFGPVLSFGYGGQLVSMMPMKAASLGFHGTPHKPQGQAPVCIIRHDLWTLKKDAHCRACDRM